MDTVHGWPVEVRKPSIDAGCLFELSGNSCRDLKESLYYIDGFT